MQNLQRRNFIYDSCSSCKVSIGLSPPHLLHTSTTAIKRSCNSICWVFCVPLVTIWVFTVLVLCLGVSITNTREDCNSFITNINMCAIPKGILVACVDSLGGDHPAHLQMRTGLLLFSDILAEPCDHVSSSICGHRRPKSACAATQSDHSLPCPLTESFDTIKCVDGEQMPGLDCIYARWI